MKKFADAQKWYEQALARKSDDVDVRTDLGLTFFLREPKDIDRTIKEYQTSLSINPNHEATLQNLAVAYSEKKDAENLRSTLAKLEKVNPTNQIIQRLKEGLQ
jgi:tetratricopeptide (TPR) repeat protein